MAHTILLIGTLDTKGHEYAFVRDRIKAFEDAGLHLLLLQMSPQLEEMERFAAEVIQRH